MDRLAAEVARPAVSSWHVDWCGLWLVTFTVGTGARYRCMCLLWAAVPGCVHTVTSHRSHRPSAMLTPDPTVALHVCLPSQPTTDGPLRVDDCINETELVCMPATMECFDN